MKGTINQNVEIKKEQVKSFCWGRRENSIDFDLKICFPEGGASDSCAQNSLSDLVEPILDDIIPDEIIPDEIIPEDNDQNNIGERLMIGIWITGRMVSAG